MRHSVSCCLVSMKTWTAAGLLTLVLLSTLTTTTRAFSVPFLATTTAAVPSKSSTSPKTAEPVDPVLGPKKVAVCGATGRTGRLVVEELLRQNIKVVALVRNVEKAGETLPSPSSDEDEQDMITVIKCDLGSQQDIRTAVDGCDAAIWCATGFSDAPGSTIIDKLSSLFRVAVTPKQTIDAIGVSTLADAFSSKDENKDESDNTVTLPKVVMLSSAGVTRPSWDEKRKEALKGCADIPIVRLNPFGILDVKAESEEKLRASGVPYCIFRPCGLNDKWAAGQRPVFSQGDVAVGRINRADVAKILVDVLTLPEAVGKTFEGFTMLGYPPAPSISTALKRLSLDQDFDASDEDGLFNTYALMQQLLPGETQDAAALAMGQTYEQLDKNEVGRLGKRGEEDAEAAAPKPSS